MLMFAQTDKPTFIPDYSEDFLELFPHRHSYLWADHPREPGARPDWQSEERHPLSDRLILQGAKLYGVRFGKSTHYILLDIDDDSRYHPKTDPYAITRIAAALEPLGLTHHVAVTSSYSGGIHLYFPFTQGQESWKIANAAAALLECNGFPLLGGQLELFPNARRYTAEISSFNGHRLPMQQGSYLLNEDFEPIWSDRHRFVNRWRFAQNQNSVDAARVERCLKQYDRRRWAAVRHKARKFLDDLNAEIEPGWTGYGQTNYLIGRIAIREYVFYHVLNNAQPLQGFALQQRILQVAVGLPGFKEYCRHEPDLPRRVCDWARCIESSPNYYPYGGKSAAAAAVPTMEETWNQQQANRAQERIKAAVDRLMQLGSYPTGKTARLKALKEEGISSSTLYKYQELWHVENKVEPSDRAEFHPVSENQDDPRALEPSDRAEFHPSDPISFYASPDPPPQRAEEGEHTETNGGCGGLSTEQNALQGVEHVRAALASIRRRQQQAPPSDEIPPDENWFSRLEPPLAGHGKDQTKIQPYLPFGHD